MQVTIFPSDLWFLPFRIWDISACNAKEKAQEEIVLIRTDYH